MGKQLEFFNTADSRPDKTEHVREEETRIKLPVEEQLKRYNLFNEFITKSKDLFKSHLGVAEAEARYWNDKYGAGTATVKQSPDLTRSGYFVLINTPLRTEFEDILIPGTMELRPQEDIINEQKRA